MGLKPEAVATVFLDADDPGAGKGLTLAAMDPLNAAGQFSDGNDGRLPATVGPEYEGAFRTPTPSLRVQAPLVHAHRPDPIARRCSRVLRSRRRWLWLPGKERARRGQSHPARATDLVAFLKTLDGPGPARCAARATVMVLRVRAFVALIVLATAQALAGTAASRTTAKLRAPRGRR